MQKLVFALITTVLAVSLAACDREQPASSEAVSQSAPPAPSAQPTTTAPAEEVTDPNAAAASAPTETISETDDGETLEPAASTVQPSMRVAPAPSGPPTSARFREGTHYRKIVPAQPTNVGPGEVEVAEVFWYGCAHCFSIDPAVESWRAKKPDYVQFVRIPAMWNDSARMHARLFYTVEALGKLDQLHAAIFRELHVNGNALNTVESIGAFLKQHGVGAEEFQKTFSSFGVESKLQRADLLNRRYRITAVPTFVVQGKYATGVDDAGGEAALFALLNELAAHEAGR